MQRKSVVVFFVTIILASCASSVQTSTNPPVIQATLTISATETSTPIPTSTFTPEPTFDWANVPMDEVYALTDDDERALGLDPTGQGIAVRTEANGVEMNISLTMTDQLLELAGGKGIALHENSDSIMRLAEAIQQGDYYGWLEDDPSRADVTLEEFLARVAAGEDMKYQVMGNPTETNINQQVEIDPSAPVKVVFQAVGEDDNGNRWIKSTAKFGFGIYVEPDGTRRYVIFLPDEKEKPGGMHYSMNTKLAMLLSLLGESERLQGFGVNLVDFNLQNNDKFQARAIEIGKKLTVGPTAGFGKMVIVPAK